MLSDIIKSKSQYKQILNRLLTPPTFTNIDNAKNNFKKSIISREKTNLNYLWRYINYFDTNFNLTWITSDDKKAQIESAILWLNLYNLVEILAFSSTRKLWITFFNVNTTINFQDLNNRLNTLYFNGTNKWNLWQSNPISLLTILENGDGYLLFFANRWEEVKYVDENQKFVSERKSSFFNIYISKWNNHNFIWIGGIKNWKKLEYITNFINTILWIDVWNRLLFIDTHFDIFESKANSITRKWEVEVRWKNEVQNKSSRNTRESDLKLKMFEWDINSIWWYYNIEWVENLNIWFDNKIQSLSISKNDILPKQYITIIETFIEDIYFWTKKEKTLEEIFQMKFTKNELIAITENEFYDNNEVKLKYYENKYWVEFVAKWKYICSKCKSSNLIEKGIINNPFSCNNCWENYNNFRGVDLNNFYLNLKESYFEWLFDSNFKNDYTEDGRFIKKAEYKKVFTWEEYNFIVIYWNEKDKRGIKNDNNKTIYIFISPFVFTNQSSDVFKIHCKTNRTIFIYFNLEIFDILKNHTERNELFQNIIDLLNKTITTHKQYVNCNFNSNNGDAYNWSVSGSQIRTTESIQTV